MYSRIILFFGISLIACKHSEPQSEIPKSNTTIVRKDHQLSKQEMEMEAKEIMTFFESRKDVQLFTSLLHKVGNIIPSLYRDDRLKVNLFIPVDKAFEQGGSFKLNKLKDNIPDDFELTMINHSIVLTSDFGWQGATSLSGEKLSFSKDKKLIILTDRQAAILETLQLNDRTKVYFLEKPLD